MSEAERSKLLHASIYESQRSVRLMLGLPEVEQEETLEELRARVELKRAKNDLRAAELRRKRMRVV
jgi:hypothetical protein